MSKAQPTDIMMAYVWLLGCVTVTAMKAYHAAWVAKSYTGQLTRYIVISAAQIATVACVILIFTLGGFNGYRDAVNAWGNIAWALRIATGLTVVTPFLTVLVGWQIHRHPVISARRST